MIQLLERFLLFVCCSYFAITHTASMQSIVLPLLIVIIISSLCGYFENRTFRFQVLVGYLILSIFFPVYLLFLPLISLDYFKTKNQYYQLLFFIPLLLYLDDIKPDWFLLAVFYLISYLFKFTAVKISQLKNDLYVLQDETVEITECLHKKNKELLESQDYEIKAATLDERNRIAREIHDSVGHQLSSSILQTGALLAITTDPLIKDRLTNLKDTLDFSMDSIRHSIHDIHDESLDLEDKVRGLIKSFSFCPISLEYDVQNDFSMKVKYSLMHIMKEALSNIMKHSNATSGIISILEHPAFYQIRICDNGTLIDNIDSDGMGITDMRERMEALNGKLSIQTKDGFEIFITLPKE